MEFLAGMVVGNIVKHPTEEKYHRLKKSSSKLQATNCLPLLKRLGFNERGDWLVLEVGVQEFLRRFDSVEEDFAIELSKKSIIELEPQKLQKTLVQEVPAGVIELCAQYRIACAADVLSLKKWYRGQDAEGASVRWCGRGKAHVPHVVLVFSHRWKSLFKPDPEFTQLRAIQFLLLSLRKVCLQTATKADDDHSLLVHGVLQAAAIAGGCCVLNKNCGKNWTLCWQEAVLRGEDILEHVGVWYDYLCLPQKDPSFTEDRTIEEQAELQQALYGISRLLQAPYHVLVQLREAGDDYDSRAWCACEVSAGGSYEHIVVLRIDLIGQPISLSALSCSSRSFDRSLIDSMIDRSMSWPSANITERSHHVVAISHEYSTVMSMLFDVQFEDISNGFAVPMFAPRRPPLLFPAMREFLILMRQHLQSFSPRKQRHERDLSWIVRDVVLSSKLHCTNGSDVVRVGLLILFARHNVNLAPTVNFFYADALERLHNGKSLVLESFSMESSPVSLVFRWKFEELQTSENQKSRETQLESIAMRMISPFRIEVRQEIHTEDKTMKIADFMELYQICSKSRQDSNTRLHRNVLTIFSHDDDSVIGILNVYGERGIFCVNFLAATTDPDDFDILWVSIVEDILLMGIHFRKCSESPLPLNFREELGTGHEFSVIGPKLSSIPKDVCASLSRKIYAPGVHPGWVVVGIDARRILVCPPFEGEMEHFTRTSVDISASLKLAGVWGTFLFVDHVQGMSILIRGQPAWLLFYALLAWVSDAVVFIVSEGHLKPWQQRIARVIAAQIPKFAVSLDHVSSTKVIYEPGVKISYWDKEEVVDAETFEARCAETMLSFVKIIFE